MTLTLKEMALLKFGTLAAFAEAAGKGTKSAKRLLDPKANLNTEDLQLLVSTLDIPLSLINPLFFGEMFSTKFEIQAAEVLWVITHCSAEVLDALFTSIDEILKEQKEATA